MSTLIFDESMLESKLFKKLSLKSENCFMEEFAKYGNLSTVNTSPFLVELFRMIFDQDLINIQECAYAIFFNRANTMVGYTCLSTGGVTGTVMDPRLLYAQALLCNATALAICHNHPSGNLSPSQADQSLTSKIKDAGKLLDIQLLDHIILTESSYFSFADEGRL